MRTFIKVLFVFFILAVIFYTINDRYNIAAIIVQYDSANQADNEDTFIKQVRAAMLEGKDTIELKFIGQIDNMEWFTEDAIDAAYNIDDPLTSSDYDYLKYKANSIYAHIVAFGKVMKITYEFKYNETYDETSKVDSRIHSLFTEWNIGKLTDYEKIKKIHDFIIDNAAYDTDTEDYSAYDNLILKSSTCQGYMSAVYKMLTEAGIPCRIITGTGNKDSHGWNIVELNGKWYNMDCTWDDPLTADGKGLILYDYFLKSEKEFLGHNRDAEFTTTEFTKDYNMWDSSYELP
jgi:hypothetical protein